MKYWLEIIAFTCGAVVMVIELVGSRLIAPYLGTSIFVWTSIIGIVLASLSFGYWWGGRVADRNPHPRILSRVLLVSAFLSTTILLFSVFLNVIALLTLDLRMLAVISSIILFTPVTVALGMISPIIVRLKIQQVATAGSAVGALYALSTLGSIVGTFLGGFFLISIFGTEQIFIGVSGVLFMLYLFSTLHVSQGRSLYVPVIFFVTLFFAQVTLLQDERVALTDIESPYSRWFIQEYTTDKNEKVRILKNDPYGVQSGLYVDEPTRLVLSYTESFDLILGAYPNSKNILLIGAGAYTYPTRAASIFPDRVFDVVELDPTLKDIAKKFFFYVEPSVGVTFIEDGRTFLNKNAKKYDVLLVDAYSSRLSIPFQLTTQEALEHMHRSLHDDGVVVANIVSSLNSDKSSFLKAAYKTYSEVFEEVYVQQIKPELAKDVAQNFVILAFKESKPANLTIPNIVASEELTSILPVLTDNFAPVEKYAEEMLF